MRNVRRYWAECILIVIAGSAALLSLVWVFKVPILQNPDEESHIDYAFSIYSANRLLNVRRAPSEWNVHARFPNSYEWELISHQYTLYLMDSTDFERVRFHSEQKLAADYGTLAYFRKLESNAPKQPARLDVGPKDNPWLVTGYPFGYYTLVAVWLKLVSLFNSGLLSLFFGARILSVFLLAFSLVLTYAMLRELRFRKTRSLALTAIVGFFPMTTFISSSVQPDNLSWTLMSVCFYLALLLRRDWSSNGLRTLLGIALGLLLITKLHFYFFTVVPILGMVAGEHFTRRKPLRDLLNMLAVLVLPSLLSFGLQYWVTFGDRMIGGNLRYAEGGQLAGLQKAFWDYYYGGPAFTSWWGTFGWMDTPLVIRSVEIQGRVLFLLSALTLAMLALMLLRLEQVLTRLVMIAGRGKRRTALRMVLSNPLMNSYFLFSVFMIFFYVVVLNSFNAQGRHWFPYVLASFLVATEYAPRALSHRKTQAFVSALLLWALVLYCAVGSYYSLHAIQNRFYVAGGLK